MPTSLLRPELALTFDENTGARVRQLTSFPAIHHHPFFYVPAYSGDGTRIVFVSHRYGAAQLFCVERESGEIWQLTEDGHLEEWSIHPSWNGAWALYVAGNRGFRVDLTTGKAEEIARFEDAALTRGAGMIGAGMGVTALSHDDRFWAVRLSTPDGDALIVTDLQTLKSEVILRRDEIGHLAFCPDDSNVIFTAGDFQDRLWLVNCDGSGHRRLRERKTGEWITHETWIPGTRELAFVDWPNGLKAIDIDSGKERRVCGFNAWHAASNRQGTQMVADTNFPDTGLHLFNSRDGIGTPRALCASHSSNVGAHWAGAFPYENGPVSVFAPQHTHPHPSFSPDGKSVVFTSDQSGYSQIYEVEIPTELLETP